MDYSLVLTHTPSIELKGEIRESSTGARKALAGSELETTSSP